MKREIRLISEHGRQRPRALSGMEIQALTADRVAKYRADRERGIQEAQGFGPSFSPGSPLLSPPLWARAIHLLALVGFLALACVPIARQLTDPWARRVALALFVVSITTTMVGCFLAWEELEPEDESEGRGDR